MISRPAPTVKRSNGMKGLFVTDAVHVIASGLPDQRSGSLVTAKESLQKDDGLYSFGGLYFLGCPGTHSSRVWGNEATNEAAVEPAECDVADWPARGALQGSSNCRHKDFISDAEVLQALADAPGAFAGLPIELHSVEPFCHRLGAGVGVIQFRNQAHRPFRQCRVCCS